LYAVGYVNGKAVVKDAVVLNNLPTSPHFNELNKAVKNITKPQENYHYIYRVNCGGNDITDINANTWYADKQLINNAYGSTSWTDDFKGMPGFFASQRRTFAPINGTLDWQLFQTFRYGRDKLKFEFPLPDGEYLVEVYFVEPWLGIGSNDDCKNMRLFDVAFNNKVVLHNIDIWKEVGTNTALKKIIKTKVVGGRLIISFPNVLSGQAIISAIAIASLKVM